jgi:hypothetical protein
METIILCTWSGIQSWSYRPPGLCPPRKWWKNLFLIWWEDGAYRFATRDEGRHKGPTTSVWDPNHDGSLIYFTFIFVGGEDRRSHIPSGWSWARDFWHRSSTPIPPDPCGRNWYEILAGSPQGNIPLERPESRREDNIKIEFKVIEYGGMWTGIHLAPE